MNFINWCILLLTISLLVSCGGGGGGTNSDNSTITAEDISNTVGDNDSTSLGDTSVDGLEVRSLDLS